VRAVLGIEIALTVEAVDGAGDRADVAVAVALVRTFVRIFVRCTRRPLRRRPGLTRHVDILRSLFLRQLPPLLVEVLCVRAAGEGDALAVRRPDRGRRALGDIRQLPGLAAAEGEDMN